MNDQDKNIEVITKFSELVDKLHTDRGLFLDMVKDWKLVKDNIYCDGFEPKIHANLSGKILLSVCDCL